MPKAHIIAAMENTGAPIPSQAENKAAYQKAKLSLKKKKDIVTPGLGGKVQPKELKLTPKQKGFALLRAEGRSIEEAAQMVGNHPRHGYHMEKTLRKYDLTNTKMLSLAHKAVKNIVQGLPVGESEAPKPSTILDAARMSMDRAYPLKTINESNSLHTFIEVKIDLEQYRQAKVIDATPSKADGL